MIRSEKRKSNSRLVLGFTVDNSCLLAESYVTVSGAKGKFSGGFDIGAFGGIQAAEGTLFFYGSFYCSYVHTHFLTLSALSI